MAEKFSPRWILISSILLILIAVVHVSMKSHRGTGVSAPPAVVEQKNETAPVIESHAKSDVPVEQQAPTLPSEQSKGASWIDAAEKVLHDPDISRRMQTVLDLRNHPSPEAVHLLANFLNDGAAVVVSEAIDTLGFIALQSNSGDLVYGILEEKAKDKGFPLRGQALVTAALVGLDKVLPLVSNFIAEESDAARANAVKALSLISTPACVPHLSTLLKGTKNSEIRRNSFNVLGKIDTPESLAILEEYLNSSNDRDQAASARALSMFDRPNINGMLADAIQNDLLQDEALKAVATSPTAPTILENLLTRKDASNGQKASWLDTLAQYSSSYGSPERRRALKEAVEPLLTSTDPTVEKAAIQAIAAIGADDTAEVLMSNLDSEDPAIRRQTVASLVGYVTPNNYKQLLDLMWDDDQETRRVAFMCVQQFVGPDDREILEKARNHPDELIREQVPVLLDQVMK